MREDLVGKRSLVDTKVEDSPIEEADRFSPDIDGRSQYAIRRLVSQVFSILRFTKRRITC